MPEEIKQEVVLKTQKYLGRYVKKPPLTEKLLKKPPFRFLHDVVNTVIKETGFLKGLFSEEELKSENVKEKDAKIAFLSKLIDAVKTTTNTDLAVRPSKIVAGLEPTETNLLLQTIGKAIEKKVDSSEYVNQLRSGQIINNEKNKKSKVSEKNDKLKKTSKTIESTEEKIKSTPKKKEKLTTSSNETPKSTDRNKPKRTTKETKSKTAFDDGKSKTKEKVKKKDKAKEENQEKVQILENIEDAVPPQETVLEAVNENVEPIDQKAKQSIEISTNEVSGGNRSVSDEEKTIKSSNEQQTVVGNETSAENTVETEMVRKRSISASRPKSARPRSGDLREKTQVESKEPAPQPIQSRPKSSLRPPSVRPSSARPGAPRLRPDSGFLIKEVVPMGKINVIVENFDKDADEEETVIIQSNPEIIEEQNENIDVPGDNKGHLVEQILEQINESDNDKTHTTKMDNDWQKDGFHGKDATTKETNNLRSLIQTLTKTANPLGKLLNYLHEDIDAMHAELETWTNAKRQLFDEIAKQKKISLEMNKPLTSQLEHLNQEIRKMEEEIVSTRSNILRNELKIKELLAK
ncbi:TRAF3-interacting protein 1 [Asbolus verrucosus]|uniref:TRAF3-interacting protein 1 n=1 Tax=Asbolus verrucosus TaxID=1661398 RepID=A0A482VQQ6_ASBVE|nr:TRAF3-interacting protein 1 [Asbolus verrucosus]